MIRDRNKTLAEEIAKAKQESIAARDAEWAASVDELMHEAGYSHTSTGARIYVLEQLKARMMGDK